MKEIADSDDSASEEVILNEPNELHLDPYIGGIAERTKERSRRTDARKLEVVPAPPAKELRPRERRRKLAIMASEEEEEDELTRDSARHCSQVSQGTKATKKKMKKDRRKALARYEAPEVEDSTKSDSLAEGLTYDLTASEVPDVVMRVQPTPGLPTPASDKTAVQSDDLYSPFDNVKSPRLVSKAKHLEGPSQVPSSTAKLQYDDDSFLPEVSTRELTSKEHEEDELTMSPSAHDRAIMQSTLEYPKAAAISQQVEARSCSDKQSKESSDLKSEPKQDKTRDLVPEQIVNYAANGHSLSIKRQPTARYRVGLSKKVRVEPLHQNIVRKQPS